MDPSLIAIVPAAGVGQRAGSPDGLPKQYRCLGGEPMLRCTVRALLAEPRITQVRVAVAAGDPWAGPTLAGLARTVWRPCGGPTRAATVHAALVDAELADDAWVMVHDAARPGLPAEALARLIDTCWRHDRGGLLAQPVADTVKRARPADVLPGGAAEALAEVEGTLPRASLWLAQTPQMFRAGALRRALVDRAGDPRVTDEASALELAGGDGPAPLLVRGARENDKLTWPADFEWFECWLRGRAPGAG